MTCDEVREAAAELALGMVSGAERAAALGHLATCPSCRVEVESLSDVADALLLLAPQAEPPLGFETRVLARFPGVTRPARRWRLTTAAAVAIAVLGSVVGVTGLLERAPSTALDREYVNALRVLGGTSLLAGRLVDADGRPTGEVFLYDGHPSWIFVTVSDSRAKGNLTVDLTWASRPPVTLTGLTMSGGTGSLGHRLDGSLAGLTSVRVHGSGVDSMGHFDGRPARAGTMP